MIQITFKKAQKARMKIHRPPHIFLDQMIYFITVRTYNHRSLFDSDSKKLLLVKTIKEASKQLKSHLLAWVVLLNHYHILLKINKGKDLSKIMKLINGRSSRRLKQLPILEGRLISLPSYEKWKVWHNYWEHGIRNEKDYYSHLNYIHHNPVKHGYAMNNGDYEYSSYNFYKNKYGEEFLLDLEEKYPIINFTESSDNFEKESSNFRK